jgi:hypothetical protein
MVLKPHTVQHQQTTPSFPVVGPPCKGNMSQSHQVSKLQELYAPSQALLQLMLQFPRATAHTAAAGQLLLLLHKTKKSSPDLNSLLLLLQQTTLLQHPHQLTLQLLPQPLLVLPGSLWLPVLLLRRLQGHQQQQQQQQQQAVLWPTSSSGPWQPGPLGQMAVGQLQHLPPSPPQQQQQTQTR